MCSYIISLFTENDYAIAANNIINGLPQSSKQRMSSDTIQSFLRDFVVNTGIRYDAIYPLYMDKSLQFTQDTIYKDGINISNPNDILWCIPSVNYHLMFGKNPNSNTSTLDNVMLDSIIWYNLIDKVYSAEGNSWFHMQQDLNSYNDNRMYYTLSTLVALALRQISLHYKRNEHGAWIAPSAITYIHTIYVFLHRLLVRLKDNSLVELIMEKNKKNFRATYGLSTNGAGVHTIKSYQNKSNKTNTTTMNYIHSDEAVLQKYKDNGSYDIIASDLPSREAAKTIKEELGINISHVTIQHCRNRIARLQAKKNSEEPCLNP